ncbi:MAG: carboxyltransferase subunit alpha [Candidatus Dormibacteria bacterium]
MADPISVDLELAAFEAVTLARHPERPRALQVIQSVFTEWTEFHGDRLFSDDQAVIGGIARCNDTWIMVIGQEKGTDAMTRVRHNFGMPHPEGYRKAARLMRLAEKFHLPVVCLIDTPAAHAGIGAEERGQAWAISFSLITMLELTVPTVSIVLSEGGSGGALALGVADRVLAFERAMYTVAPPETCAAILYRDASQKARAALSMKPLVITAHEFGIVDELIPEVASGIHTNPEVSLAALKGTLLRTLGQLSSLPVDELLARRMARYGMPLLPPPAPLPSKRVSQSRKK